MPWPIVSGPNGDFPRAWQWQMEKVLLYCTPDWIGIWDDDMILTDPPEASRHLHNPDIDLIYGPKLFLWDSPERYNRRMEHNSVVFFRHYPGDAFHEKRELQVHCPKGVHACAREKKVTLTVPILDYGFMTENDRRQVFAREKRTGKIDGFTKPLVEEPDLADLPSPLLRKSRAFAARFAPQ